MSDLMRWQSEDVDVCKPAEPLLAALKEADLTVDVKELYFLLICAEIWSEPLGLDQGQPMK